MAIHWTKTYPLRPARSLHQRSQPSTEKYLVSVYPELKLAERLVEKYKGQLQVYKSNKKPVISTPRTNCGLYVVEGAQPDEIAHVVMGSTATVKRFSIVVKNDDLMDDVAVEPSGNPNNATCGIEEESGHGEDLLED
ncbi:hypothetical protein E4U35_003582 [Claviceps purpurea]|nr:hypothetical protein E4U35_003582 [Claviceps purpurea]KAG6216233.1 hypothetical protein E4U50_006205 [Claviceps purpurea]KAG6314719.1 hypothetical protein E4U44_001704 [Claviceps purpurea]